MFRTCLIGVVCMSLHGCGSWPVAGDGGMAEQRPTRLVKTEAVQGLQQQVEIIQQSMNELDGLGLQQCLPGQAYPIKVDLAGSVREIHAGMLDDAALRLKGVALKAERLRCRLASVKAKTGCVIDAPEDGHHQTVWFQLAGLDVCGTGQSQDAPAGDNTFTYKPFAILNEALFDTDSAAIKPIYHSQLDLIAILLMASPDVQVRIIGHTDDRGGIVYNDRLSMRRAEAVAAYLSAKGVPASRVSVKGAGELQPRQSNHTVEGRQLNRRVEIDVEGLHIEASVSSIPLAVVGKEREQ